MVKNIEQIKNCSNCFLCKAICPMNCIAYKYNTSGFICPQVRDDDCIECGKCLKNCPSEKTSGSEPISFYGLRHRDSERLKKSTSGGAFSLLSDSILSSDGIVCGAVFNDDFKVVHICTDKAIERDKMCGAKYVLSDISNVYEQIASYLSMERKVLFSGTPCQVSAVKGFLLSKNISTDNFYTVDIICHGSPSPMIFKEYLRILQKRYGKLTQYKFRDKSIGWRGQNVFASFDNGTAKSKGFVKYYSSLYFGSYISMDCCHSCKYSSLNRVGDITLGDFWGVEKYYHKFDDNKGVSLVMLNSEKGIKLFQNVCSSAEFWEIKKEECMQANLISPTLPNKHKEQFYDIYHRFGFVSAYNMTRIWKFTDDIIKWLYNKFEKR